MYIEVENLTKVISKNTVLNNINIKMEQGKIYGLKGKNGSGKTMLMRAICGLIIPTEGRVIIDGKVLSKDISFPESIGALIESPGFISNYSGYKNLKILAEIQGKIGEEKIKQTISLVGLDPEDKKKFKKYSLGMKQKLGIAAAIMEEPKIIILDEPTNALDENSIKKLGGILRDLRDRGTLIVISCHDSEELNYLSDEIFFIENGEMKKHIKVKEEVNSDETEE
jgi:ABC-2 type transport system ATP-binding protein